MEPSAGPTALYCIYPSSRGCLMGVLTAAPWLRHVACMQPPSTRATAPALTLSAHTAACTSLPPASVAPPTKVRGLPGCRPLRS